MKKSLTAIYCSFFLACVAAAGAQAATLEQTLTGAEQNGPLGDAYGSSVAFDGDWMVVGAPRENGTINNAGAAYIYRRSGGTYTLHTSLKGEGNHLPFGDRFGAGVTIRGDWLMVAAPNDDNFPGLSDPEPDTDNGDFYFAGQVYVYRYDKKQDTWNGPVQKLSSDVPISSGSFGARTQAQHLTLVNYGRGQPQLALIGEPGNVPGRDGKIHVFKRKGKSWKRTQIVTGPTGGSFFADSIVVSGHRAFVSESYEVDGMPGFFTNDLHVYKLSGASVVGAKPIATLTSPTDPVEDGTCPAEGSYGSNLGVGGNTLVAADPCSDGGAGSLRVYRLSNSSKNPVTFTQKIDNPEPSSGVPFGERFFNGISSIATDGNVIAVGSSVLGFAELPVYVYRRDSGGTFNVEEAISSPAPAFPGLDAFGQSVFFSADQMAIIQLGVAPDPADTTGGALFLFAKP